MKWLLITTIGRNPGDEFARIGTQNLIREVDPSPEFELLDKETDDWHRRTFDRAVLCGMPLFWDFEWSQPGNQSQTINWWDEIFHGWPTDNKRKFLALGVGHVYVDKIADLRRYAGAIQEVIDRSWAVTVREPVIDHPQIIDSVCPSAFCLQRETCSAEFPVCNLMPAGGHFPQSVESCAAWQRILPKIVDELLRREFVFAAHTEKEALYALKLGFPEGRINARYSPGPLLDWYSKASCYFGNRLHGAAVCASVGKPTLAVTFDSRLGMVRRLGGAAVRPEELTEHMLEKWLHWPFGGGPTYDSWFDEKRKLVNLLRRFAQ